MKVRIKLHDKSINTPIPRYAKPGDAGLDLVATSKKYEDNGSISYGTNLCFEIPEGYVGLIFPRSSNVKKDLLLSNSVAVIDSGYRGEVVMKFKPSLSVDLYNTEHAASGNHWTRTIDHGAIGKNYQVGDRICQIIIVPYPNVEFELVEELSDTERGSTGYGSSGK